MTLDQLITFANSKEEWQSQIALTKAGARNLAALIHQLKEGSACPNCEAPRAYDLVAHESLASRANPMAAAFAVQARKGA
jgi:hypothetical protein